MTSSGPRAFDFDDTGEMHSAVADYGWDVTYTQLSSGDLDVEAFETKLGDFLLYRERYGCPVMAHGRSPRDAFDVLVAPEGTVRLFGEQLSTRDVGLFPPRCEIDAVGLPGLEVLSVQVRAERLEAEAERMDIELVGAERALVVSPGVDRVARLVRAWSQAVDILRSGDQQAWNEAEEELVTILVAIFDASAGTGFHPETSPDSCSSNAVAVLRYIVAQELDALDLGSMADELGVGRHHLNRCFKEHYGVSIRGYLRLRRLHNAREMLSTAGPDRSVTNTAYACGFRHLGRFSVQYRELFGESPTKTLRRAAELR